MVLNKRTVIFVSLQALKHSTVKSTVAPLQQPSGTEAYNSELGATLQIPRGRREQVVCLFFFGGGRFDLWVFLGEVLVFFALPTSNHMTLAGTTCCFLPQLSFFVFGGGFYIPEWFLKDVTDGSVNDFYTALCSTECLVITFVRLGLLFWMICSPGPYQRAC